MTRPNVLFIFTDDQRFDTIAHLFENRDGLRTPNFDRLARRGTSFNKATIMGGMLKAVCCPSRNMLMTGRGLFEIDGDGYNIPAEHTTFPEHFRSNGYFTFGTGKWHQDSHAFNRSFSDGKGIFMCERGGMKIEFDGHWHMPYFEYDETGEYAVENRQRVDLPIKPFTPPYTRYKSGGRHSSTVYADTTIDFLNNYDGDDPFLIYTAFFAPHDPRQYPTEYFEMYDPDKIELPPNFMARHPFNNGDQRVRDELLAGIPRLPWEIREHIRDYYAIVTHLDHEVGRILDVLDARGLTDNTYIVFAGDNGLAVGQHGLMGKQNMYDHSLRVPLIISGPGIPADETRPTLCHLNDVYATLCDLCELDTPESVTGRSLVPALSDSSPHVVRKDLYFGYRDIQRAMRDEQYKFISYNVNGERTLQLFDLDADPWEMNNLAETSEHAERLQCMTRRLAELREESGDHRDWGQRFWEGSPQASS